MVKWMEIGKLLFLQSPFFIYKDSGAERTGGLWEILILRFGIIKLGLDHGTMEMA